MSGFGDRIRIQRTAETEKLGLAGREGQIFGWTTPSVTGVSVIGTTTDDYAVNVHFDELNESFWFSDDLIEHVDHAAGTTTSLDGVDKEWVRLPNGDWVERPRST
jgi:hypothetical protein